MDQYLTVEQLAEHFQMSKDFWDRKVAARVIPFKGFGRSVRFSPADVAAIEAQFHQEPQRVPTRDELVTRRRRGPARTATRRTA